MRPRPSQCPLDANLLLRIPISNLRLPDSLIAAIIPPCPLGKESRDRLTGRGAVRLARLHGVQEVPGSIPGAPTQKTPLQWGLFFIRTGFPQQGTVAIPGALRLVVFKANPLWDAWFYPGGSRFPKSQEKLTIFCINQDHFEHQSQTRLENSLGDRPGIDKPWCGRSLYSGRNSLTRACKPPTSCQELLRSQFLKVRTNLSAIPFVSGR